MIILKITWIGDDNSYDNDGGIHITSKSLALKILKNISKYVLFFAYYFQKYHASIRLFHGEH